MGWLWLRPAALVRVGMVVAAIILLFFVTRVYTLLNGPAIENPALPLFMPLYAYLPFAYFCTYILLQSVYARIFSLCFWASITLLVVTHLLPNWQLLEERYGGTSLLVYLLIANPMFILMLEIIDRMERQISRALQHLAGYRRDLELRRQIERHGERFKLAVLGSRDGLWEWPDMDVGDMWWSDRTFELLKLDPSRVKASTGLFLERLHPEDAETIRDVLRRTAGHSNHDVQVEFRLLRGDGEYQWFAVRAVTVPSEHSGHLRMAGSIRNIHQQKQAELGLRQSNKTLDEFARVVAHDLRSPLNRMTLTAGLVKRRNPDLEKDPEGARLLDMVQRQCKYMSELIDSALEFARAEAEYKAERVDLAQIMQRTLEFLESEIRSRDAEVIIEDLPAVMASPVDMTRLFQNLLSNALKFNEGKPVIRITTRSQGPFVEISVSDNGIGIPQERLEDVLLPMHRIHTQAEYKGHGIGLAVVNNIVHRSGGRLHIESEEGQGTTFRITLLAAGPARGGADSPE